MNNLLKNAKSEAKIGIGQKITKKAFCSFLLLFAFFASNSLSPSAYTQSNIQPVNGPVNDPPNPYTTVENWAKMPEGRKWGATSAVDIDRDGKSIWVAERCGANTCAGSNLPTILKFDASGKLVRSFGEGMFVFAHGIHVDGRGNIWVTDGIPPGALARRRPVEATSSSSSARKEKSC